MIWSLDPVLAWVIRLVLAALFATAAGAKLAELGAFEGIVRNYRVLPGWLVMPVARTLPFAELAVAAALLVPPLRVPAALACAGLLLVFALAMAINIGRGRTDIDCGCFVGRTRQRIGWPLVLRNLVLAGAALALVPPPAVRPLVALDFVTVAGGTLVIALALLSLGQLAELAPLRAEAR